jgi:hypothetical protein
VDPFAGQGKVRGIRARRAPRLWLGPGEGSYLNIGEPADHEVCADDEADNPDRRRGSQQPRAGRLNAVQKSNSRSPQRFSSDPVHLLQFTKGGAKREEIGFNARTDYLLVLHICAAETLPCRTNRPRQVLPSRKNIKVARGSRHHRAMLL